MRDDSEEDAFQPVTVARRAPYEEPANGNSESTDLLRALVGLIGRAAFPEHKLRDLVSPSGNSAYFHAYRMCDGRTPLTAIVKQTGIDSSNLSKAVGKWVDAGVMFRIGPKHLPLNLYAVTQPVGKAASKRGRADKTSPPESVGVGLFNSANASEQAR